MVLELQHRLVKFIDARLHAWPPLAGIVGETIESLLDGIRASLLLLCCHHQELDLLEDFVASLIHRGLLIFTDLFLSPGFDDGLQIGIDRITVRVVGGFLALIPGVRVLLGYDCLS